MRRSHTPSIFLFPFKQSLNLSALSQLVRFEDAGVGSKNTPFTPHRLLPKLSE